MGRLPRRQTGWWRAPGPRGRVSRRAQAEDELLSLLRLGGGVPERLVASVAAAWRQRLTQPDRAVARARPQLDAALHGRLFAAMRSWLGGRVVRSELAVIREDDEPRLVSEPGLIRAEVPFGWLVDVWAKDLATIWGRFCLAATTDDGSTWRLTTVAPDLGPPSVIMLGLDEGVAR
jgi:hypothetical protein